MSESQITVLSGYDRKTVYDVDVCTLEDVKSERVDGVLDRNGNFRRVKVTSVKTWKTRPNDARLGWKYGMYEFGYTEFKDGVHVSGPTLVRFPSRLDHDGLDETLGCR